MKIGLTYDLREEYLRMGFSEEDSAEFDRADTIDAIESALQKLGYETDRIGHIFSLVQRLGSGERWDLVFNICEGVYGIAREAQVPALLDAYQIPSVFSDPMVLALTLHKGMTKHVIQNLGLPTPDFFVLNDLKQLDLVDLPYPLFAKPVAEGTGKGINASSKIKTKDELKTVCANLLSRYRQPVLIETFLSGREFTVGITGTGTEATIVGTMEVVLNDKAESEVYSYINKEKCEELVKYVLVDDSDAKACEKLALEVWKGLHCRDGGRIDIRLDADGKPSFMEVNPLAGLHPEHSDLPIICNLKGIEYVELIRRIVDSALRRL